MCEVLTMSGLSFMVKMIREIISMPRADSGYLHNFMVNFWVFKDDESESDAKTNSRHRVCLLLVGSLLLAWRVHAQSPLFVCMHAHAHTVIPSPKHSLRLIFLPILSHRHIILAHTHTHIHIFTCTDSSINSCTH